MDKLTTFLTSMIAERVVEIIKGFSKTLREDPDPKLDPDGHRAAHRRQALQAIAAVAGAGTALTIGPSHFLSMLPDGITRASPDGSGPY